MRPRGKPAAARWTVVVLVRSCGGIATWPFPFPSEAEARGYFLEVARALPRVCACPARVALREPGGRYLAEYEATPAPALEHARRAWPEWTDAEIAEEFAPWPPPGEPQR